jgi:hypothetical protein
MPKIYESMVEVMDDYWRLVEAEYSGLNFLKNKGEAHWAFSKGFIAGLRFYEERNLNASNLS